MLTWILQYWIGIAFGALSGLVLAMWGQLRAYRKGLIALLHNDLVEEHKKYVQQRWIPIWAMESFSGVYHAYITLDKNPAMTKLYEELVELPSQPPKQDG